MSGARAAGVDKRAGGVVWVTQVSHLGPMCRQQSFHRRQVYGECILSSRVVADHICARGLAGLSVFPERGAHYQRAVAGGQVGARRQPDKLHRSVACQQVVGGDAQRVAQGGPQLCRRGVRITGDVGLPHRCQHSRRRPEGVGVHAEVQDSVRVQTERA